MEHWDAVGGGMSGPEPVGQTFPGWSLGTRAKQAFTILPLPGAEKSSVGERNINQEVQYKKRL
jgi:hypothetical protein